MHVPRLPFALDPLIAEANRRMRLRRLLVACVAVAVAGSVAGLIVDLPSTSRPVINQAGLHALVGTWGHHGASLVIRPSGWGLVKSRTYREKPPGYAEITFRVISVTRTGRSVDARIRVTHGSSAAHTPAGTLGTVRLLRGVIYWSTATFKGAVTFCSVKPGARWICGT